jgi:hypothetical protein
MKLTEEQIEARRAILTEMKNSLIKELTAIGVELSEKAVCDICANYVEIGIKTESKSEKRAFTMDFGSAVQFYAKKEDDEIWSSRNNEINFGSSGVFTPENTASYWRTIHAASILKNWDKACEIVNKYCDMYANLVNQK